MRISDWSSDVCSSDLLWRTQHMEQPRAAELRIGHRELGHVFDDATTRVGQLCLLFRAQSALGSLARRGLAEYGLAQLFTDPAGGRLNQLLARLEMLVGGDRKSTRLNSSH